MIIISYAISLPRGQSILRQQATSRRPLLCPSGAPRREPDGLQGNPSTTQQAAWCHCTAHTSPYVRHSAFRQGLEREVPIQALCQLTSASSSHHISGPGDLPGCAPTPQPQALPTFSSWLAALCLLLLGRWHGTCNLDDVIECCVI